MAAAISTLALVIILALNLFYYAKLVDENERPRLAVVEARAHLIRSLYERARNELASGVSVWRGRGLELLREAGKVRRLLEENGNPRAWRALEVPDQVELRSAALDALFQTDAFLERDIEGRRMALSSDARLVAFAGADSEGTQWVGVLDLASGRQVGALAGVDAGGDLAVSINGRVVAALASSAVELRTWELASGKPLGRLHPVEKPEFAGKVEYRLTELRLCGDGDYAPARCDRLPMPRYDQQAQGFRSQRATQPSRSQRFIPQSGDRLPALVGAGPSDASLYGSEVLVWRTLGEASPQFIPIEGRAWWILSPSGELLLHSSGPRKVTLRNLETPENSREIAFPVDIEGPVAIDSADKLLAAVVHRPFVGFLPSRGWTPGWTGCFYGGLSLEAISKPHPGLGPAERVLKPPLRREQRFSANAAATQRPRNLRNVALRTVSLAFACLALAGPLHGADRPHYKNIAGARQDGPAQREIGGSNRGEVSYLQVSGIYPHLASFSGGAECGIGAVVPWAGRLWWITYPPHARRGSSDKLYSIDEELNLTIHRESVGGTHACRMIHRESNQLIIGPYFINAGGRVRAADVRNKLVGRMTAVTRHLFDPANKVYYYDMEGAVYEVDVRTLEVTRLFEKPVPGWHGKGAYVAQGRLVVANNGEHPSGRTAYESLLVGGPSKTEDEAGVLAEWDGREWRIVARRQFTDVTGPGGIHGAGDEKAPLWAVGWDKRSVILQLLDQGRWHTYRLPKASYTFDPRHGWYTEWPRIREIAPDRLLMVMHGAMYDFPKTFSSGAARGVLPVCQHLRYIPDFCGWRGKIVLAADDTSIMQNPMAGQSQSNLWIGEPEALEEFGTPLGFGGVWLGDDVKARQPSDPFLVAGYDHRVLHLSIATDDEIRFSLEVERGGSGEWSQYDSLTVPPGGYRYHIVPVDLKAEWIRVVADRPCRVSAFFHMRNRARHAPEKGAELFRGLARVGDANKVAWTGGLLRPARRNRNLMFLATAVDASGTAREPAYYEVDASLNFHRIDDASRAEEVRKICAVRAQFRVDEASVILDTPKGRLRLPKGSAAFDRRFATGSPRAIRECVSERSLANLHGTFYEIPRGSRASEGMLDFYRLKPVASHDRLITDFCTWRGLLVVAGCRSEEKSGPNYFKAKDSGVGLWFGHIDELWKLGKPLGIGGPWNNTLVEANRPSDPYLMTGYDRKRLVLSHDATKSVVIRIEVDVYNRGYWKAYREVAVLPGEALEYKFEEGFGAHWVRLVSDRGCVASAVFYYE